MSAIITKPAPQTYDATCSRCGAGFSYGLKDLSCTYSYFANTVNCPSCGERHRHPDQRTVLK